MSFLFSGFEPNAYEATLRSVRVLFEILRRNEVRVSPGSRMVEYLRELEHGGGDVSARHQALLELDDLRLIVDALTSPEPLPRWQDKIQPLLAGRVRPEDDTKTTARNLQFELVLAALLRRAGYEIELREPDIVVTSVQPLLAFAAKRPTSHAKLGRNVKDADRQIKLQADLSNLSGVVAVDLSRLLNPKNGYLSSESFLEANKDASKILHDFVRENAQAFRRCVNPRTTIAIAAHFTCAALERPTGVVGYLRTWCFANMCAADDLRLGVLRRLGERVGVASFLRAG